MNVVFFFFQAEDGIRDIGVTGVQTCALPISLIIVETDVDMEIPSGFHGLAGAFFYLLPISLGLMLGQNDLNLIGFVVSQCACIHVGLIVHFLQRFLYFLAG